MTNRMEISDKRQLIYRILSCFSFIVLPFIIFYWLLPFYGTRIIGNDYVVYPIEQQLELQYSIEHNSFPLYIPGFAGGRSSAALTLGQIFHPISHLSKILPGYWNGYALEWNTFWRLIELGVAQLLLFNLLLSLKLSRPVSFFLSFITVFNLRMLDSFRYGASHESYLAHIFLCAAIGFHFLKPTKFKTPLFIIVSTYLLITSGHPQIMYFGLIGAGIAALATPFAFKAIREDIELSRNKITNFYLTVGICTLTGLLLANIYTIPFYFDFVADNASRVGRNYAWSLAYSDTWGGALRSFFAPLGADVHGAFGSSPIIIFAALLPLLLTIGKRIPLVFMFLWSLCAIVFTSSVGGDTFVHHLFWKYFPLAQTFRVPGRINSILPFITLLILVWVFRPQERGRNIPKANDFISGGMILSLLSFLIFCLFNWYLVDLVPQSSYFIPERILSGEYPVWINQATFWIGFSSLLFAIGHQFSSSHKRTYATEIFGILLCIAIVIQGCLQIRYGTWITAKTPTKTLAQMDADKEKSILFQGDSGYGMESPTIIKQMKYSFLENSLAKFYRKKIHAVNQDEAYYLMATKRTPDTAVIEADMDNSDDASLHGTEGPDQVSLTFSSYNKLQFVVESKAPGYVVLSYPFSTKWSGLIDGRPTKIYRANGNLIAVHLDKGKHSVTFQYFSKAAFVGILTSCITLLLAGVFFSFSLKAPRLWALLIIPASLVPALVWHRSLHNGDNLNTIYYWNSSHFPPNENLAYGRPTSMSSIWTTQLPTYFYAGKAVDGERQERGFVTSSKDRNPWWEVDLGGIYPIGDIMIYAEQTGRPNPTLTVLFSQDGESYNPVEKRVSPSSGHSWQISTDGKSARFIRISSSTSPMSFREVEVYKAGDATSR